MISKLQRSGPESAVDQLGVCLVGQEARMSESASVSRQETNLADSEKPISTLGVCADAEGLGPLSVQDAISHEGVVSQVGVLGPQPAHQGARPGCLHHRELVQALGVDGKETFLERPQPSSLPQHFLLLGSGRERGREGGLLQGL